MTIAILAEKPSAARNMGKALGGMSGTYQGQAYEIAASRGHLYELKQPHEMVPADQVDTYKSWDVENLPWDSDLFAWALEPREDVAGVIRDITKILSGADEIVVATDVDPTGEGGAIAGNIILELGLGAKKISRMYFTDEAPASIQKAFVNRKVLPGGIQDFDEYKKAIFRSRLDMLTMQHTRIATKLSGQRAVYRQGRLKSAIVTLVGDGLKAYNDYKKIPFYENRFKDENEVVYKNADEPRFKTQAEVPQGYGPSKVVLDGRANKRTAPPRLMDLAALSAALSPKGFRAADVLKTYQAMYTAQIVSYPRTEDKTITTEQFNELLPKIDQIAAVVGADASLLTHRTPRKTHVKDSGAHGANRPGPQVPSSLDSLAQKFGPIAPAIYELLARNYLAMVAEDYVYEHQEGHLESYPDFLGSANIPLDLGFKAIFDAGDDDEDDDSSKGLGTHAEPFIHEGFPPRPPYPTQKWLMKQLEKRDVGTGATRTSTYAEVTNEKTKYPLLVDKRGRISMSEHGEVSYLLLPGTHIGDLGLTERVYADMRGVADGSVDSAAALRQVAQWVSDDIVAMGKNAVTMRDTLGLEVVAQIVSKEKAEGTWKGQEVTFNREWGGVRFTDEQVGDLLAGKVIEFEATSKQNRPYTARGQLAQQKYAGRDFIGFKLEERPEGVPDVWAQHTFTDAEKQTLESGGTVKVTDAVNKLGKPFSAILSYGIEKGQSRKKIIPDFNTGDLPKAFCGHTFTAAEISDLKDGKGVTADDFFSKRTNKPYSATVYFRDQDGTKKLQFDFGDKKSGGKGSRGGARKGASRGRRS